MFKLLRACSCSLILLSCLASGQDLNELEKRVTEFTLENGLRFIVLERHEAPVVSFHSYVRAGSVNDPCGKTGLAHMFEHMAFKGTTKIGSRNYAEEAKALAAVEAVYDRVDAGKADPGQLASAIAKADSFVDPNAYPRLIEENGGVDLNAGTGEDATEYYYSLPANRIELWFLLESQRFLDPVLREFYKERDVVRQERRMRIESDPEGKLMEALLATAFAAHPYREPTGGWASDVEHLRVKDAREFFDRHYVPGNVTIAIAGDVDPKEARRLAEKYFSPWKARPLPSRLVTVEARQEGEKRVRVETASQPFLAIAYKRPDQNDKDDPVFDVIAGILSEGRTGLLYKELVRDRQIALAASASATLPGGEYPNLFLVYVVPNSGHTVEENERASYALIERLKNDAPDAATLARVKTQLRASVIRQLDSNSGMAAQLTFYRVNYGDWRKLFTGLQDIDRVTAEDVHRVARQHLVPRGRTVAYTAAPEGAGK